MGCGLRGKRYNALRGKTLPRRRDHLTRSRSVLTVNFRRIVAGRVENSCPGKVRDCGKVCRAPRLLISGGFQAILSECVT